MYDSGFHTGLGSRRRSERRYGLIFFLALSFALIVLSRNAAEASVFEKARAGVAEAAAPLLEILSGPIGVVAGALGEIDDYFGVIDENRRLKQERDELLRWKARAIALEQQVVRLERLANMTLEPGISFVTARVIGDSEGPFVRAMIVDAGGPMVARGQAVVDDYGLMGHIIAPGRNASRVLLLTDLNSRIPVYIEGANVAGVLSGDNSSRPVLRYLEEEDTVALGQRVITSGDGGVLPRGLPIGVVSSIEGGAPRVKPFVDFDRTEIVRILDYRFPTQIEQPETQAGQDQTPETASAARAPAGVAAPIRAAMPAADPADPEG